MSSLPSPYNFFSISVLFPCLHPFPYPCNLVSMCPLSVCVPSPPFAYVFFPCISSLARMSSERGSVRPGQRQDVYLKPELSFKSGGTVGMKSLSRRHDRSAWQSVHEAIPAYLWGKGDHTFHGSSISSDTHLLTSTSIYKEIISSSQPPAMRSFLPPARRSLVAGRSPPLMRSPPAILSPPQ